MKEFHVTIEKDDDDELVYKPTYDSDMIKMIAEMRPYFKVSWTFEREDYRVIVYPIALDRMPKGEELEEIEYRVLKSLNLIQ